MAFVEFNRDTLEAHLGLLNEDAEPSWGKMTPQQMVEHLIWSIQLSIGEIERPLVTPDEHLEKTKQFLMSNRPMPRDFHNKAVTAEDLEYAYEDLDEAKDALLEYFDKYESHFEENPEITHLQPVFGVLNRKEWDWLHRKHCTHHFEQFALIEHFENL